MESVRFYLWTSVSVLKSVRWEQLGVEGKRLERVSTIRKVSSSLIPVKVEAKGNRE